MLIALGTEAAMKGYRVRYTLATKLVNELVEAADEKQLNKTIARYGRVDLLCIDELGYMELDRHGAELLFQVLATSPSAAGPRPSQIPASVRPSSTVSLQRHDHRDRHRLLPPRQHPGPSRRERCQLKIFPPGLWTRPRGREAQGHRAISPAAVFLKPQASK
ncbi:hypothetical protein SALBM311S_03232 [Streptomyces alboniger]